MNNHRYTPKFKDDAVRQVMERGYTVSEVSQRLGVSAHSLYKWVKAVKPDKSDAQAAELVEAKSDCLDSTVSSASSGELDWYRNVARFISTSEQALRSEISVLDTINRTASRLLLTVSTFGSALP